MLAGRPRFANAHEGPSRLLRPATRVGSLPPGERAKAVGAPRGRRFSSLNETAKAGMELLSPGVGVGWHSLESQ